MKCHLANFFPLFLMAIGWSGVGCTSTPYLEAKTFMVEREWIKSTLKDEYLDYRRLNRMKPVVSENLVVAGNAIDQIVAFDRMSGKRIWSRELKDGVEGGAQLADGRLYFGSSDGFFYALNLETGVTEWTFPVRAEILGEPLAIEDRVYFLSGNNVLHALNARSGEVEWTYSRIDPSQFSIRGASRPLVVDSLVYVGFSDGTFLALNKSNGTVVWENNLNRNRRFRDVDSNPVLDQGKIYVSSFDGALYCLNKDSGQIIWTVDEGGYSSVIFDKDNVYYGSTKGKVMALDKNSGKIIWSRPGVKGFATEPVLYRGLLIYGESAGALKILDARTGNLVDEFKPGRGVTSGSYLDSSSGQLYFMSADALLYKLRLGWTVHERYWPWE